MSQFDKAENQDANSEGMPNEIPEKSLMDDVEKVEIELKETNNKLEKTTALLNETKKVFTTHCQHL